MLFERKFLILARLVYFILSDVTYFVVRTDGSGGLL